MNKFIEHYIIYINNNKSEYGIININYIEKHITFIKRYVDHKNNSILKFSSAHLFDNSNLITSNKNYIEKLAINSYETDLNSISKFKYWDLEKDNIIKKIHAIGYGDWIF